METNKNNRLLAVVSLSVLVASLGTSIVNIALPSFTEYFSASFQSVQWVVIAYLLTVTVFVIIVGKLADQYGHRNVLFAGIVLFTLSSFLAGFAKNIYLLIVLRGFQGIGAAALSTVSMAMAKNNIAQKKMGTAMGLMGTMSAIGTAMGPSVGGLLLANLGWSYIFFFLTVLGCSVMLLSVRFVPKEGNINKDGPRINFAAVLLLSLSVGAYALTMTISKNHINIYTIILFGFSMISVRLFFTVQKRGENPLIDIVILKNKALVSSLFSNFVVASVMMTTLIVGPFFLSLGLGLNEARVGLLMTAGPVISILTGIPSGKIVDKIGTHITMKGGLFLLLAGTFALAFLPAIWGWVGYICGIILLTPGYQLFQAANNTSVMLAVVEKQGGIVSGILNLFRNIGLVTGASLMGTIFSMAVTHAPVALNKAETMFFGIEITFLTASLPILLVLIKTSFRKN